MGLVVSVTLGADKDQGDVQVLEEIRGNPADEQPGRPVRAWVAMKMKSKPSFVA